VDLTANHAGPLGQQTDKAGVCRNRNRVAPIYYTPHWATETSKSVCKQAQSAYILIECVMDYLHAQMDYNRYDVDWLLDDLIHMVAGWIQRILLFYYINVRRMNQTTKD